MHEFKENTSRIAHNSFQDEADAAVIGAVEKICDFACCNSTSDIAVIQKCFDSLDGNIKAILVQELSRNPQESLALRLESAREVFNAAIECGGAGEGLPHALRVLLPVLARVFQEGMTHTKRIWNQLGEFHIQLANLLPLVRQNPADLALYDFTLEHSSQGPRTVELVLSRPPLVAVESFSAARLDSHTMLPGRRVAYVGVGGGSDVVQCGEVALVQLAESDKEVSCLISVRREKYAGQSKTIQNTREVMPGVFRIFPETLQGEFGGSGRFLEPVPAGEFPVYLVIEAPGEPLSERIEAAIRDADAGAPLQTDAVIAVDTGGDGLMDANSPDTLGRTTPDLDYRSLKAVSELPFKYKFSVELGIGIDSPADVEDKLHRAYALCYDPPAAMRALMLEQYRRWDMTGENPERFGLTPFCYQCVLREPEALGYRILPVPAPRVLDRSNPWHTQKHIQPAMRCFFYMEIARHLEVIEGLA